LLIAFVRNYINSTPRTYSKIVILVPTRELVVQAVEEVEKLTDSMSVGNCWNFFGGVNMPLKKPPFTKVATYFVGTRGRIMDLWTMSFVLKLTGSDEFDEMLNLGSVRR
jgi:ATP-dependent RNA helicase RhlE